MLDAAMHFELFVIPGPRERNQEPINTAYAG
jgi:hypothetical protein